MAEWIPSALSDLVDRLTALVIRTPESSSSSSSTQLSRIREDIEFLRRTWPRIQAVLADAEDMEILKESVRHWLHELRGVAYDAEDMLDEYEYELPSKATKGKKVGLYETSSTIRSSFLDEVANKVGEIRRRLDEIAMQREGLQLREGDGDRRLEVPQRPPSTHIFREARVFGRDDDKEALIGHLVPSPFDDNSDDDDLAVVALIGMGGVGKTTLAQLVFNDPRVQGKFGARGWVHASEDFDLSKLTDSAIQSLGGYSPYLTQLSPLQERLVKLLSKRKFFLVVDDVWNASRELWDTFMAPFRHGGAKGSRILITTRTRRVAEEVTRSIRIYQLDPLSRLDCWEVFKHHAFSGFSVDENPSLVEIGSGIVGRCGGLPLAAKALGGVLGREKSERNWRHVLDNDLWGVNNNFDTEVLAALRISYNHLPTHLKWCFLYSSVYPKGYRFEKDELVRLWMAQSLVCVGMTNREEEDEGMKYIEHLWWSSFFVTSRFDPHHSLGNRRFVIINDLMHDLAQYILTTEYNHGGDTSQLQTLHAPLLPHNFQRTSTCRACLELRSGRTFLQWWYPETQINLELLPNRLVQLRVLDLTSTEEVEEEEGPTHMVSHRLMIEKIDFSDNLKHLRYLALRNVGISFLPESIFDLRFLQTLDIRGCWLPPGRLPRRMGDMKNLRHLLIPNALSLPIKLGRLTNLHELNRYEIVGYDDDNAIGRIKYLVYLGGELTISRLRYVRSASEAMTFELHEKKYLERLVLEFNDFPGEAIDNNIQEEVIENLKPHVNLKELRIDRYSGFRLPSWFGDPSFVNLTTMELKNCYYCRDLRGLGQFPFLKLVIVYNLPALECLDDGLFPFLERLVICHCPKLDEIPMFLRQSNYKLKLMDISDSSTLSEWCKRKACSLLAHIPELILDGDQFYYPRDGDKMIETWIDRGDERR